MAKILVAEDDKFLSGAYKAKLTTSGYEVKVVFDGAEALKEFSEFSPNLVILDLKMPKVDGFWFLQELKNTGQISKVPIIVASNSGDKPDIERALALGARDYVVKSSLSMKGLIEKVDSYLKPAS
jgi:two-component system phosphate regulon response regulator PhoB/two-component system alkaline phosphatase synthesis response regulator PhoP